MQTELRRAVLQLYADADRDVAAAGPVCVASGRCCRFTEYGHTLFLSNLEADVLLAGAPPYDADAVTATSAPSRRATSAPPASRARWAAASTTATRTIRTAAARSARQYLSGSRTWPTKHGVEWLYAPLHRFLKDPALGPTHGPRGRSHQRQLTRRTSSCPGCVRCCCSCCRRPGPARPTGRSGSAPTATAPRRRRSSRGRTSRGRLAEAGRRPATARPSSPAARSSCTRRVHGQGGGRAAVLRRQVGQGLWYNGVSAARSSPALSAPGRRRRRRSSAARCTRTASPAC